jgi:hypothetical protein
MTYYFLYAYVVCDSHSVRHYSQPQSLRSARTKKVQQTSIDGWIRCTVTLNSLQPASMFRTYRRYASFLNRQGYILFAVLWRNSLLSNLVTFIPTRFLHTKQESSADTFWSVSPMDFHGGFRERTSSRLATNSYFFYPKFWRKPQRRSIYASSRCTGTFICLSCLSRGWTRPSKFWTIACLMQRKLRVEIPAEVAW